MKIGDFVEVICVGAYYGLCGVIEKETGVLGGYPTFMVILENDTQRNFPSRSLSVITYDRYIHSVCLNLSKNSM